ncbi:MAG: AmmeMemoRadiSam system protein A [Pseudomonadota bacterium]|nr:AmmeMemoRadiSam system protein A [Pseudomonadota bacterium]
MHPHADTLFQLARRAIEFGLDNHGQAPTVPLNPLPEPLRQPAASFVSLHMDRRLTGCIGSLAAHCPLAVDVAANACAAAFRDPRFAALERGELADTQIEISLLSIPQAMVFESEQDLLNQLRPGRDGLILRESGRSATFLPVVWSTLPEPHQFLRELKRKAGLPGEYWSETVEVLRYHTTLLSEAG